MILTPTVYNQIGSLSKINPIFLLNSNCFRFKTKRIYKFNQGYFTSEEGLKRLEKKQSSGKPKPAAPAAVTEHVNEAKVLATAKELSDKLSNVSNLDTSVSTNPFPPGPPLASDVPSAVSLEELWVTQAYDQRSH